jgi:hypothetical protein
MTIVSTWRCQCGISVKVVGEHDGQSKPPPTQSATCPKCGDKQTVYADKIISVIDDSENSIHPTSGENS